MLTSRGLKHNWWWCAQRKSAAAGQLRGRSRTSFWWRVYCAGCVNISATAVCDWTQFVPVRLGDQTGLMVHYANETWLVTLITMLLPLLFTTFIFMSISAFFHLTKLFKVANLFNMLRKCSDLTHVPWLGSWDHLVLAKENNMNGYLLLMQFEKLDMSSFIFFSQPD